MKTSQGASVQMQVTGRERAPAMAGGWATGDTGAIGEWYPQACKSFGIYFVYSPLLVNGMHFHFHPKTKQCILYNPRKPLEIEFYGDGKRLDFGW